MNISVLQITFVTKEYIQRKGDSGVQNKKYIKCLFFVININKYSNRTTLSKSVSPLVEI